MTSSAYSDRLRLCTGGETYTYNQGIILGGLCWLHRLTGDVDLLVQGADIIDAVLANLTGKLTNNATVYIYHPALIGPL